MLKFEDFVLNENLSSANKTKIENSFAVAIDKALKSIKEEFGEEGYDYAVNFIHKIRL